MANKKVPLSVSRTINQFDNGYWYAAELKTFAEILGVPSARKLRKDELEKAIKHFLAAGEIKPPTARALSKSGLADLEKGLSLALPVANYTSNRETKNFIREQASKIAPGLKRKSGSSYRTFNPFRSIRSMILELIRLLLLPSSFAVNENHASAGVSLAQLNQQERPVG